MGAEQKLDLSSLRPLALLFAKIVVHPSPSVRQTGSEKAPEVAKNLRKLLPMLYRVERASERVILRIENKQPLMAPKSVCFPLHRIVRDKRNPYTSFILILSNKVLVYLMLFSYLSIRRPPNVTLPTYRKKITLGVKGYRTSNTEEITSRIPLNFQAWV